MIVMTPSTYFWLFFIDHFLTFRIKLAASFGLLTLLSFQSMALLLSVSSYLPLCSISLFILQLYLQCCHQSICCYHSF